MTDKDNFDDDKIEEEFDFLDDEDVIDEESFEPEALGTEPTPPKKPKIDPDLLKKAIAIGVAVIAIGLGIYYFISKPSKEEATDIAKLPAPPKQQPTTETPSAGVSFQELKERQESQEITELKSELLEELIGTTKEQQTASSQALNILDDAIRRLDQEVTSNSSQIRNLQYSIQELSKAMSIINNNIGIIDNKLSSLNKSMEDITADVSGVKQIISDEDLDITSKKVVRETIKYQEPDYTVHAVIPGRAWLKDKSGKIITVTEGEELGRYGKITTIDHINSIVSTSSGVTFR